jgi:apurinic endonuclease APN1
MSLIGIDIRSYDDMEILHEKYGINLFQISARYLATHIENTAKPGRNEELILPNGFKVVVHYSYSINLAHTWSSNDWWIQQLIEEIKAAEKIGAFAIIIHTGKSLNYAKSTAINNMYSSLLYVHNQTAKSSVKILIETPAGQGTELLSDIEHFIKFMNKFNSDELRERFGICVDTCHIYSAGYDIAEKKGIEMFFKTLHDGMGIERVKLIHLNNSRAELGSNVDRHESLDKGTLSMKAIRIIVKFIDALGIPMVLETPLGDDYEKILKDYAVLQKAIKK